MDTGATQALPHDYDVLAPDGSEVRVLLARRGGSMAHFRLPPGQVSRAVRHRTVEEIWYILSGTGEMWRGAGCDQSFATLSAGVCLAIPVGVAFQFRASDDAPLEAVGITMPPWPGPDEAEPAEGPWKETCVGP
ncbi:MAG: cupin domain-containing protein [Acetobacteraceae bacterium]|nr:cupin domain-containing protein [Pseudomonadota bacterium]